MNEALKAAQAQLETQLDEALDVVWFLASRAKYQEAHVATKLAEIQALLTAPFEDPHDTTLTITAGQPVDRP